MKERILYAHAIRRCDSKDRAVFSKNESICIERTSDRLTFYCLVEILYLNPGQVILGSSLIEFLNLLEVKNFPWLLNLFIATRIVVGSACMKKKIFNLIEVFYDYCVL